MPSSAAVAPERAITTGASRGFTVLLLGGAVQPIVATAVPPVGVVWLVLVAVAAFASSAWIATGSDAATLTHAVAASVAAYALVVPVVYLATGSLDPLQLVCTAMTACAVGALVHKAREARR